MFLKLRKLLIWTFAVAIFSGGFLTIPSPQKAKAAEDFKSMLATCSILPKTSADTAAAKFGAIIIDSDKIKINATVDPNHSSKAYSFTSKSVTGPDAGNYVKFLFKSDDYSAAELSVTTLYSGVTLLIKSMAIIPAVPPGTPIDSWTNEEIKNLAKAFNEKAGGDHLSSNFDVTCLFSTDFGAGDFPSKIQFHGDSAPTIRIGPKDEIGRPATIFTLKYVLHKKGIALNDDLFLFQYSKNEDGTIKNKYANIFIKLFNVGGNAFITQCGDGGNYKTCREGASSNVVLNPDSLQLFWNHVYNSKSTGNSSVCGTVTTYQSSDPSDPKKDKNLAAWTSKPDIQCINGDANGWLAKWGVTFNEVSFTNPAGEGDDSACGITGWSFTSLIGRALCSLLEVLAGLAEWITNTLFKSVFNAFQPPSIHLKDVANTINPLAIQQAHAADEVSSLTKALTAGSSTWVWVIPAWKFVLTLTDLFLVVILLFLGIVNILHIQYDTYAIKKMLPLLIVGVILANFSLLIMRMLIDASNILTQSFMGDKNPGTMVSDLITAANVGSPTGFWGGQAKVWGLLVAVIFSFFAIAAFVILGVMFYVRYAVILLLAIAAPLAFVAMAFPPTQSLFKQWWSITTKFVFMKPIALFFIYIAIQVKGGETTINSLTGWMIVTALVYFAIIVPWKLGGAVMSMWGGAMGSLFGTKQGGWARKPVDDWWQRRKDQAGALAKVRFPKLFAGSEADRIKNEAMKKAADSTLKQEAWKRNDVTAWEGKAAGEETKLKDLINKRTLALEEGKLDLNWWLRLNLVGVKNSGQMAQEMFKNAASLEISTKNLEAHRKDATWDSIIQMGRDNTELSQQIDGLKGEGIGLDTIEVDSEGKIKQTTLYKLDKNGEVERDDQGNPVKDVATYRDYLEGAAFARMSGLAAKDPKIAQNYFNSAAEMEKKAAEFARVHTEFNGKPVLYNAFMDKNKAGRIFSVTTSWILDEISTNTLNENAETMPVRFKEGGYGWRNNRGTHNDLVNLGRGQYSKVSPTAIGPAVAEYRTWLEFIGRKGGKDRGRFAADFFDLVDTGEIYGEENKGRLLRSVLEKENSIRLGATDEFLAEAILSAKRRGLDNFSGINIGELKTDSTQEVIASLKSKGIESVDAISAHPEIFRQLDLTPSNSTRAQRNMLDGISDLLEESSNFCGAGNPVGYTVRTKDRKENDLFKDFQPVKKSEDIDTIQKRRADKAAKAQQVSSQEQVLASSTPEQVVASSGSAQKAIGEYEDAATNLIASENQIIGDIKINNNPIDASAFRGQIAQAIQQSVAASFAELQNELQQQFAGLTINIPQVDTPEAIIEYKRKVAENQAGISTLTEVDETARAENIKEYSPIQPNESLENLQKSLGQLEEASQALKEAADFISKSKNPATPLPESVVNKALDALANRGGMVDLTKTAFKEDETKMGDALDKITISLRAAINAKQESGTLNDQVLLKAIKAELKRTNEAMINTSQGGQAQGTPIQPQPPSQTPPTTPPGSTTAPDDLGGGNVPE
ncbi:MAG: hypothetical protein WCV58_03310 [Patescibacteria group bacterium]